MTNRLRQHIASVYQENEPERIYFLMLYNIFNEFLEDLDEDLMPKDRTGYKNSLIWNRRKSPRNTTPSCMTFGLRSTARSVPPSIPATGKCSSSPPSPIPRTTCTPTCPARCCGNTDALAACFDTGVDEELVKLIAQRKPLRVVFRDAGFADDSSKINVEQIFKSLSPRTEVKSI